MSNEPKGTDALQSEIAREYRNMKSSPGLEMGLRPELGTYELCDKHYDASHTESEEHCAVCRLKAELAALRVGISNLVRLDADISSTLDLELEMKLEAEFACVLMGLAARLQESSDE